MPRFASVGLRSLALEPGRTVGEPYAHKQMLLSGCLSGRPSGQELLLGARWNCSADWLLAGRAFGLARSLCARPCSASKGTTVLALLVCAPDLTWRFAQI